MEPLIDAHPALFALTAQLARVAAALRDECRLVVPQQPVVEPLCERGRSYLIVTAQPGALLLRCRLISSVPIAFALWQLSDSQLIRCCAGSLATGSAGFERLVACRAPGALLWRLALCEPGAAQLRLEAQPLPAGRARYSAIR